MNQTKYGDNSLIGPFFKNLVRRVPDGGIWGCSGGMYIINKTNRTFVLVKKNGDNAMLQMNALCIPKYTGYKVVEAQEVQS
jgi:hypothetical protein